MTTVTIETAENGYIIKQDNRLIVATSLNSSSWSRTGKTVLDLLEEIFEPPEPVKPAAPAVESVPKFLANEAA